MDKTVIPLLLFLATASAHAQVGKVGDWALFAEAVGTPFEIRGAVTEAVDDNQAIDGLILRSTDGGNSLLNLLVLKPVTSDCEIEEFLMSVDQTLFEPDTVIFDGDETQSAVYFNWDEDPEDLVQSGLVQFYGAALEGKVLGFSVSVDCTESDYDLTGVSSISLDGFAEALNHVLFVDNVSKGDWTGGAQ